MNYKQMLKKPLEEYFDQEVAAKGGFYESVLPDYYASANDLAVRRQKINCLDTLLENERARQAKKKLEFRQRWAAASKQIANVDKSILSFERHYNEAIAQQDRAHRIIVRQDELKAQKLAEIGILKKEKQLLNHILEETSERVSRFQSVKEYLEAVTESSQGEFKNIRELLDRYKLLEGTRQGLLERDNNGRDLIRRRQKGMDTLSMTKENEAILLSNDLFELTEEYRELDDKLSRLTGDLVHIKTSAAHRTGEMGRVRIAVYNLYLQVCKKMSRPAKIPSTDTLKQLHYIRYSMVEVNKLRKEVQIILKRAKLAQEKEKQTQLQLNLKKLKGSRKDRVQLKSTDMFSLFKIEKKKESKKDHERRLFLERHKIKDTTRNSESQSHGHDHHSKGTTLTVSGGRGSSW